MYSAHQTIYNITVLTIFNRCTPLLQQHDHQGGEHQRQHGQRSHRQRRTGRRLGVAVGLRAHLALVRVLAVSALGTLFGGQRGEAATRDNATCREKRCYRNVNIEKKYIQRVYHNSKIICNYRHIMNLI